MECTATPLDMSGQDTRHRLRDTFARVIAPKRNRDHTRDTSASSYEHLIRLLAAQIDETVLPRKFELISDAEVVATLVVSNRRLIALTIGEVCVGASGSGDQDATDVARGYAQALKTLSADHEVISLRSAGRAFEAVTSGTACSAKRLAGFGDPSCFENQTKLFLEQLHGRSLGWIYTASQDEPVGYDPDDAVFAALHELHEALEQSDQTDAQSLRKAEPNCTAFAISQGVQALIATERGRRLVIALPEAQSGDALLAWRALFGGPDVA